jgi:homogentisate 1,2-dioxygenase
LQLATMPVTQFAFQEKYRYQNGFNSYHEYAT